MATHNQKRSAPELRFMVQTTIDGFNSEDRKLIRSHVMKGKNKGKMRPLGSRRDVDLASTQKDKALLSVGPSGDGYDGTNNNTLSPLSSSSESPYSENRTDIQAPKSIPPRVGSVASTMYLADSVEPETLDIVLQFSSIAKPLLFAMETCIFFERRAENWIAPLAVDPAFLHANIFTSLYYFDVMLTGRSPSENRRIAHHYHKAVSLLRERLLSDENDIRLSNTTISVVLSLAGQAFRAGNLGSALNHIQGIQRMIDLRGGLSTLVENEKLITEILRCDLGISVQNGSSPVFFREAASSRDYRVYPQLGLFLDEENSGPFSKSHGFLESLMRTRNTEINSQLAAAWDAMSDFCSVINLAADSDRRIKVGTFLHSMTSIMYNLIDMRFEPSSWDETVRLALLSFSCSVFLPWTSLGMSYSHLDSVLRNHLADLAGSLISFPPTLVLWLLMSGAITISGGSGSSWIDDTLHEAANLYGIQCWGQMRDVLKSILWIDIVHDKLGRRVFEATIGRLST